MGRTGHWTILAMDAGADVVRAEPSGELELDRPALWAG